VPTLTLITEQVLARVPGGTGRYTYQAAAAVAAARPEGWRTRGVVAWHPRLAPARIPGLAGPRRLPLGARVLPRVWARSLPPRLAGDVVHALTPLAPPRRPGQVLVVTVHDDVPYTHPELLTPHGAAWHRTMIDRAAREAAVIAVPTRAAADGLRAAGIDARIEVAGAGPTPAMLVPVGDAALTAARRHFHLPPVYLITVATLEPRKGLDVLLDALVELPGVHLAVVGRTGWGHVDPVTETKRRGLADRVHLLGGLSDADLAAVLAGAAASVSPSRSEGFGLPLLEAMSRGIPVVHSAAPALVEVSGGAGVLTPVGDSAALATALAGVLNDPLRAQRLAVAGRLRAADFSWAEVAQRMWAIYTELAG